MRHEPSTLLACAAAVLAGCVNPSHELELGDAFDRGPSGPPIALSLKITATERGAFEHARDADELRESDEAELLEVFEEALKESGRFRTLRASASESDLDLRVSLVRIEPDRSSFAAAQFLFYLVPASLTHRTTLHANARTRDGRTREYELADEQTTRYWLPLLPIGLAQIVAGVDPILDVPEHLARVLTARLERDGLLAPTSDDVPRPR